MKILGGFDFINEIKDKYLNSRTIDRNVPALIELSKASISEINQAVKEVFEGETDLIKNATLFTSLFLEHARYSQLFLWIISKLVAELKEFKGPRSQGYQ